LPAGDRGRLILFTPDLGDTSTVKRAAAFLEHGYALDVFGFRRDRYNRDYRPSWPHVLLGRTADGRYAHRAFAVLAALGLIFGQRRRLRSADILFARNIDQLVLATLARAFFCRKALVVYEILDIPPLHVGAGPASRLLRALERGCLAGIGLLVVSSPAFMRYYFEARQGYRKDWFLLENKVHPALRRGEPPIPTAALATRADRPRSEWVVGYCGLIRGEETFALIMRLAARLRGRVRFSFHGVLTTVDRARFERAIAQHPNITYGGDYLNPDDLARIYGAVDLAWALDLEHKEHNSRWLLPCRFYEAGLYGVPCLAIREFEIGRLIDRLQVGWTFAEPLEDQLVRFFETLTPAHYAEIQRRLRALPASTFVAGDDVALLCARIDEVRLKGAGPKRAIGVARATETEPARVDPGDLV
jgi:succinoglycan biosynthesis protein ExoL